MTIESGIWTGGIIYERKAENVGRDDGTCGAGLCAAGADGQEAVLLDLTKLAQAVISLAAGIVSLYLVPWLRSKLTNEQLSKAKSWVQIAVYAAEKLYGAGNGDQKLAYAEAILRKHGIRLDTATLKAMIDAQIKEMENMEPFYLADAKVEMIDNPKPETA